MSIYKLFHVLLRLFGCYLFIFNVSAQVGAAQVGAQVGGAQVGAAMPATSVLWRMQLRTQGSSQMYTEENATLKKGWTMRDAPPRRDATPRTRNP